MDKFDIQKELTVVKSELNDFIKYFSSLTGYVNKTLPKFYSTKIKELSNIIAGFEDLENMTIKEIRETTIFKYVTKYLELVLPISEELSKTNINLFELKEYVSILEKYKIEKNPDISKNDKEKQERREFYEIGDKKIAIYIPETTLDFCALWEDREIMSSSIKKRFIVILSVLFKKTVSAKDTLDKIEDLLEKKQISEYMDIGLDRVNDILDNTLLDETEREKKEHMSEFFNIVTNGFVENKINPMKLVGNLLKGNTSDLGSLMSLVTSVSEKTKESNINDAEIVETLLKMSGEVCDTTNNENNDEDEKRIKELEKDIKENKNSNDTNPETLTNLDIMTSELNHLEKKKGGMENINQMQGLMKNLLGKINKDTKNGNDDNNINMCFVNEMINALDNTNKPGK
jgi:uncharacterized protein (DUF305 family)